MAYVPFISMYRRQGDLGAQPLAALEHFSGNEYNEIG